MVLPADPLHFWQALHPNPHFGFFFGWKSGSSPIVYMSAGEPRRLYSSSHNLSALDAVERALKKKSTSDAPRFVGFLNFDEGRHFDKGLARLPRQRDRIGMPPSFFGDYDAVVKIDYAKKEITVYGGGQVIPTEASRHSSYSGAGRLRGNDGAIRNPAYGPFEKIVMRAKEAIRNGDIYQANLSLRFDGKFDGDPLQLYRLLCEQNPSPYAGVLKCGSSWIVSNSPELLIRSDANEIVTRPIAGTRPRGKTASLDRRQSGQLLLSPKERAEHIMLVDLERNDLGRVCRPGTVRVSERFAIERYSHVMHIVSEVRGRLKTGKTSIDAVKAVFPGGTITGCPKIRSVEMIEALEKEARGVFYGSAGFFRENGDATFNILIRTAFLKGQRLYLRAGAGIVADSHPKREYAEILAKAGALREAARKQS